MSLHHDLRKLAAQHPELGQHLRPLLKQATVAKFPIFSKPDAYVKAVDIEKQVLKHYRKAIPGTLKIEHKVSGRPEYGTYINWTMENADPEDPVLTGSIAMGFNIGSPGVHCYAIVRIDGGLQARR